MNHPKHQISTLCPHVGFLNLADGISVVDQAVKLVLSWPKSKYSPLSSLLGGATPRVAPEYAELWISETPALPIPATSNLWVDSNKYLPVGMLTPYFEDKQFSTMLR